MHTDLSDLQRFAGAKDVIFGGALTDILGSTELLKQVGEESMGEILAQHFAHCAVLADRLGGCQVKTFWDSTLCVFKSVISALDFGLAVRDDPGHPILRGKIRVAVHFGAMTVLADDVQGNTIIRLCRMLSAIKEPQLVISDEAFTLINAFRAARHRSLSWTPRLLVLENYGPSKCWTMDDFEETHVEDSGLSMKTRPPAGLHEFE